MNCWEIWDLKSSQLQSTKKLRLGWTGEKIFLCQIKHFWGHLHYLRFPSLSALGTFCQERKHCGASSSWNKLSFGSGTQLDVIPSKLQLFISFILLMSCHSQCPTSQYLVFGFSTRSRRSLLQFSLEHNHHSQKHLGGEHFRYATFYCWIDLQTVTVCTLLSVWYVRFFKFSKLWEW